jgi:hypothetical protein
MDAVPVQILPSAFGEATAAYLFGQPEKDGYSLLFSSQNGLILRAEYAKYFRRGDIVILPTETDPNEFEIIILAPHLRDRTIIDQNGTVQPLQHRRLQFCNTARPAKKYLYTHCLLTLARRYRKVEGWEDDVVNCRPSDWGRDGIWGRETMVRALCHALGRDWHTQFEDGLGVVGVGAMGGLVKEVGEEKNMAWAAGERLRVWREQVELEEGQRMD